MHEGDYLVAGVGAVHRYPTQMAPLPQSAQRKHTCNHVARDGQLCAPLIVMVTHLFSQAMACSHIAGRQPERPTAVCSLWSIASMTMQGGHKSDSSRRPSLFSRFRSVDSV
eukprot:6160918-Prymnesium_polylepis.2